MTKKQESWALAGFIGVLIIVITLPYILAWRAGGDAYVFDGFLYNPADGNSYLAKMRQGWNGSWTFTFPYMAEPGEGAYIHLYYITIGHLSRITGLSLIFGFHFFRTLGVAALYIALFTLCKLIFEDVRSRWTAFLLAALGSGLGWIFFPFGVVTSDVGVPEIYPFYASISSGHFPLSMALLISVMLLYLREDGSLKGRAGLLAAGLAMSIVTPFGTVIAGLTLGTAWFWNIIRKTSAKNQAINFVLFVCGSGPLMVYYYWLSKTNFAVQGWNLQNISLSSPVWDTAASLLPLLWFALPGAVIAWKSGIKSHRLLVFWMALSLVLAYSPSALQRRMLTGIFIPMAILAAFTFEHWFFKQRRFKRFVQVVFIILCIMTTAMNVYIGFIAGKSLAPVLFLTSGEIEALDWMQDNLAPDSVVLTSSSMGMYVPAHSDLRVLYGHPYETSNALYWEDAVNQVFSGELSEAEGLQFLKDNHVKYIFIGPRERDLGVINWLGGLTLIHENNSVQIFLVGDYGSENADE